ncbi:MAG TPA: molecular chaperone HtpG [Acidobacteria bacterium]|nr:molecular chaperone HtpG [Acidobacteriota bacterium]
MSTDEKHAFTAEVQELLNLMVHSLYSQKDIFLRELISNSSDALDRLRVEALSDASIMPESELEIRLEVDTDARTLSISDTGIGMSREQVVSDIGTIAKSGSREFLAALKEKQRAEESDTAAASADLIGQFGVGFYSTFMVADRVILTTRRAGTDTGARWESTGDGTYTLADADRLQPGTTVTLHLKPTDEEDGLRDYADTTVLTEIVKKHSDFVAHPIRMKVERQEPVLDNAGVPVKGMLPKTVVEDETLNSMKAIWTRSRSDVTDDEYHEFYRHVGQDWQEPLAVIPAAMEGTFNARILLFIPSKAPFDLYHRERITKGVQLYVKRIHIMDDWKALLPEWLRFLKGVIDCEDLSLNVSREILQHDRQVKAIRTFAVKKTLDAIDRLSKDKLDAMRTLWREFGAVLKEGLASDEDYRDRLLNLLLASTTYGDEPTSLADYLGRMPKDQEHIYYLGGSSLEAVRNSPHLESFKRKGVEVLFFTDPVDEFWLERDVSYKDKTFVSVSKGEIDLGKDDADEASDDETSKKDDSSLDGLLQTLRSLLQDDIKDVRVSGRLTDSPACLVGDKDDLSPQLEQMMRQLGQAAPKTKRILEINPDHPFVVRLGAIQAQDAKAPELKTYAQLLHGQAILAEGSELPDPGAYSRIVMEVANLAVGASPTPPTADPAPEPSDEPVAEAAPDPVSDTVSESASDAAEPEQAVSPATGSADETPTNSETS